MQARIAIAVHSRRIGQPEGSEASKVATTSAQLTQLVRDREAELEASRPFADFGRVRGGAFAQIDGHCDGYTSFERICPSSDATEICVPSSRCTLSRTSAT